MASLPKLPKQSTPNGMKLKPASSQGDKCLAILFDSAILAALPMTKLAGGTAACMGDMTHGENGFRNVRTRFLKSPLFYGNQKKSKYLDQCPVCIAL